MRSPPAVPPPRTVGQGGTPGLPRRSGAAVALHQGAGGGEAGVGGVDRHVLDEGEHAALALELEVVARHGALARRAAHDERPPVGRVQTGGEGRGVDLEVGSHGSMMLTVATSWAPLDANRPPDATEDHPGRVSATPPDVTMLE